MLYGIKIWGISGEIFEKEASLLYESLSVCSFMERGVIQNEHRIFRKFWQKILFYPIVENVAIYRTLKEADGKQASFDESPYHMGSPFSIPVMGSIAALSSWGIAISSWHIMSKTALIYINNRSLTCWMLFYFFFKSLPGNRVCLRVPEGFFL